MTEDKRNTELLSHFKQMVAADDLRRQMELKPKYVTCPVCKKPADVKDNEFEYGHSFHVPCYHCNTSYTVNRNYLKMNRTDAQPTPPEPPKPNPVYPSFVNIDFDDTEWDRFKPIG